MPARVFAALLASDSGRLTSAELSALLKVSPAAVSGAVRYLAQVNLVSREGATVADLRGLSTSGRGGTVELSPLTG